MNTREIFNLSMCTEIDYIDLIDREYETQNCIESILSREKMIVMGKRGVGKTSLIYKVRDELIKYHSNVYPLYIQFSPIFINSGHPNAYLTHLLYTVIHFIWKDIIGKDFSDIYNSSNDSLFNGFENRIVKIYKLIRTAEFSEMISSHKEMGVSAGLSGNLSKENENDNKYYALTNQEIINLLKEVCEHLVTYLGIETVAFLCDEANNLKEKQQIELEDSLISIFDSINCSFIYVSSLLETKKNDYFDLFENSIVLEGFNDKRYTKELIFSRIRDNNLFKIDDESISIIHNTSKGNPRFIIRILGLAIYEESRQNVQYINITPSKAAEACNKFIIEQVHDQEIINGLIDR